MVTATTQDDQLVPAFVLSSVISAYPGTEFNTQVRTLLADPALDFNCQNALGDAWAPFKAMLEKITSDDALLEDLRSEYIDVFERPTSSASPYETEYGRDRAMVKGRELVDIAGFYRAFGLDFRTDTDWREMLDHVSVELEFYSLLLMKQLYLEGNTEGEEIVRDARIKFLRDHLGRFVQALADRPAVLASPFYSKAFALVRGLVDSECASLGAEPTRASWVQTVASDAEMSCGAGSKGGSACSV